MNRVGLLVCVHVAWFAVHIVCKQRTRANVFTPSRLTQCQQSQWELLHVDMAQQAVFVFSCCSGLWGLVLTEDGPEEGESIIYHFFLKC